MFDAFFLSSHLLLLIHPSPSKAKKTGKIKTGILRKSIDTIRGFRKSLSETLSNSSNCIDRLSENAGLYSLPFNIRRKQPASRPPPPGE